MVLIAQSISIQIQSDTMSIGDMNQKMLAIATLRLTRIFSTTTMALYADESETETVQELK